MPTPAIALQLYQLFRYGGHGALLSRGLLDRLPAEAWDQCARRLVCGAADHRLATCIHYLQPHIRLKVVNDNRRFLRAANTSMGQVLWHEHRSIQPLGNGRDKRVVAKPNGGRAQTDRQGMVSGGPSGGKAQTDRQGMVFDGNQLVRERFLSLFAARHLCPWSIHKLPPHRADLVHAAARHCIETQSETESRAQPQGNAGAH